MSLGGLLIYVQDLSCIDFYTASKNPLLYRDCSTDRQHTYLALESSTIGILFLPPATCAFPSDP